MIDDKNIIPFQNNNIYSKNDNSNNHRNIATN